MYAQSFDTRALARELAGLHPGPALLPGFWTVEPAPADEERAHNSHRWTYMVRADGARIFVGTDSGRVFFSPDLPGRNGRASGIASDYSRLPAPRITVDPTRGAAAVARDVARRFLPAFDALWADVVRVRAEIAAESAARDAVAAALRASGFSVDSVDGRRARNGGPDDPLHGGEYPLRFSVQPGGSVRVEGFTIEAPAARRVLDFLRAVLVDGPAAEARSREARELAEADAAAARAEADAATEETSAAREDARRA